MKVPFLAFLLCAISVLLVGCADTALQSTTCTRAEILAATSADHLKSLTSRCVNDLDLYFLAHERRNNLAPTPSQPFALQAVAPLGESERVTYELDVFFYFLDALPADIATEKLNDLIRRLNTTYKVESVQVIGSQDPDEADVRSLQVAKTRAENVKRYLLAAGLAPNTLVSLSIREAKQSSNAEGRARDRIAEVKVSALRRKNSGG
jgi:outer membrane protein OmpA-like peptidoglycan-associated protein